MPDEKLVFRNNAAMFGWIFMTIWTAMLAVPTWRFIRDGGFHQFSPTVELAIIALFWLVGLVGCAHAFAKPRVRLTIADGDVELLERWVWHHRVEQFPLRELSAPTLIEDKDSESGPYFRCTITTPSGRTVSFSEHYNRQRAEAARDRLMVAKT